MFEAQIIEKHYATILLLQTAMFFILLLMDGDGRKKVFKRK